MPDEPTLFMHQTYLVNLIAHAYAHPLRCGFSFTSLEIAPHILDFISYFNLHALERKTASNACISHSIFFIFCVCCFCLFFFFVSRFVFNQMCFVYSLYHIRFVYALSKCSYTKILLKSFAYVRGANHFIKSYFCIYFLFQYFLCSFYSFFFFFDASLAWFPWDIRYVFILIVTHYPTVF